jgi:hypothetical protein
MFDLVQVATTYKILVEIEIWGFVLVFLNVFLWAFGFLLFVWEDKSLCPWFRMNRLELQVLAHLL